MITAYHFVMSCIVTGAVAFNTISLRARSKNYVLGIIWLFVAIFVGLRFEVGGDWHNYLRKFDSSRGENLFHTILINKDIGYALLVFFANKINAGIWLPNLICAVLFVIGFRKLNLTSSQPALFLLICFPYIITIVAMGYTRQSAAIGCAILALTNFYDKQFYRSMFFYLLAISFHKFAVIIVTVIVPLSILLFVVLVFVLLLEKLSQYAFFYNYLFSDYVDAAKGAELRATITLIAGLYLLYICRNTKHKYKKLMINTSYLSAILFVLSFYYETAVDRIGLYFLYLQPMALSEFNPKNGRILNSALYVCIVLCYFALLIIWFAVSDNVHTWAPYRFYI